MEHPRGSFRPWTTSWGGCGVSSATRTASSANSTVGGHRVFLARDASVGRRVVLKLLRPGLGGHLSAERFRREIRVVAALLHPHIVPLLTAGVADDLLYFTMPYVAGESLRNRLQREGPLPLGDALHIARDVAGALAHARARGVVHDAVSPAKVLLSGDRALVTGFGIARLLATEGVARRCNAWHAARLLRVGQLRAAAA